MQGKKSVRCFFSVPYAIVFAILKQKKTETCRNENELRKEFPDRFLNKSSVSRKLPALGCYAKNYIFWLTNKKRVQIVKKHFWKRRNAVFQNVILVTILSRQLKKIVYASALLNPIWPWPFWSTTARGGGERIIPLPKIWSAYARVMRHSMHIA